MTELTAPPETTTVATPEAPSPLIGTPVCVPFVPPEPEVLIFTMLTAVSYTHLRAHET